MLAETRRSHVAQNRDVAFRRYLRFTLYWNFVVMLSGPFVTPFFLDALGMTIVSASSSEVVLRWTIAKEKHYQPHGIVHGGAHCGVVETLASVGAATWLGDRGQVVGVNNSTDFFRAVSEGRLTSTATPVHRGRSQQVWLVETVDEDGRMVSRGQVRLQNLAPATHS